MGIMFQFQDKPFFDPNKNFYIPASIPFGGELNPKLKPREWWCWILDNSLNSPKGIYRHLVGTPTTVWRIRKSLKIKGYGK